MATVKAPANRRPSIVSLAWALLEESRKKEKAAGAKAAAKELAIAKDTLVRSEPYLRLVAGRACMNCGTAGYSQAAHLPPEGKQIKVSDLDTFPLCTVHPDGTSGLVDGCHKAFDHYELFPREEAIEQGRKWIRQTQTAIYALGWPKNTPMPAWLEKKHAKAKPPNEAAAAGGAVPDPRDRRKQPAAGPGRRAAAGGRNPRGAAKPDGRKRQR